MFLNLAIALHRPLQKLQCSLAIAPFHRENLEDLSFVIDSSPQVMRLVIDPNQHLVNVPTPSRIRLLLNTAFTDLGGKHRTEPVPPEPHRLVADVDTTLEQQIFDLAQRQRVPDVHHHREADDLRRTVEIAERILHPPKLRIAAFRLKRISSDSAATGHRRATGACRQGPPLSGGVLGNFSCSSPSFPMPR